MNNENYIGKELDLFSNAKNWKIIGKRNFSLFSFNILDVSSGIDQTRTSLGKSIKMGLFRTRS